MNSNTVLDSMEGMEHYTRGVGMELILEHYTRGILEHQHHSR